jgi:hypothetical protein
MLQARTPLVVPELLEDLHHRGGSQGVRLLRNASQGVEVPGAGAIRDVEVEEVAAVLGGHAGDDLLGKVAMGVNEGKAFASPQILQHEGLEKR